MTDELHELKTEPQWFDHVACGRKTFEVRRDDRAPRFARGHVLRLREYIPGCVEPYTGREARVRVTRVWRGLPGVEAGHVVMTVEVLP